MKLCLYCQSEISGRNGTKEHIIPKSYLEHLKIDKEKIPGLRFSFGNTWVLNDKYGDSIGVSEEDYRASYKIYIQIMSYGFVLAYYPCGDAIYTIPSKSVVIKRPKNSKMNTNESRIESEVEEFYLNIGIEFQ